MKIKTSELKAEAGTLDWAVTKCEQDPSVREWSFDKYEKEFNPNYSTNWYLGGPIIEREGITITHYGNDWEDVWSARKGDGHWKGKETYGPTPLIAAMRCFVASKLGEEVDVPEELCEELSH